MELLNKPEVIAAIIAGMFTIIGIILKMQPKKTNQLLEEELEETINSDGSRSKREKRRYKQ